MEFGYESLQVSRIAKQLIIDIYRITQSFPKDELYGLTSQVRRAIVSVMLNIAEGSTRKSKKEFHQFVRIARSSLVEVDCGIKIAIDLSYIPIDTYDHIEPHIKELYFKLVGLEKYLLT